MIDNMLLRREERAVFALRDLYRRYGYLPFRMSKFEEYELYFRNKDFLVSDRIISFNDTNGRLMALKPDVTLSIIKSGEDLPGVKQKVCYNENVYRVSENTHRFKEIMQSGLECIGDIDLYDIYETICLAAESLSLISDRFVLEVSHLGILSGLLEQVCGDESFLRKASGLIAEKNAHDLRRLCESYGIPAEAADPALKLVTVGGPRDAVLAALPGLCDGAAAEELRALSAMLDRSPFAEKIRFDFSVVNDMNYYNGIVFKGFLDGVCEGVLAGGQYDRLMAKMGRRSGAVGFAVYLDLLEQLRDEQTDFDVDVLLLYDAAVSADAVASKTAALTAAGKSVSAQREIPPQLRYRELIRLEGGAAEC